MDYLPIFLHIRDRSALLVGGGAVAVRKARLLRQAGARLTVVAPELAPELAHLATEGRLTHRPHPFRPDDLEDMDLVVAATDDLVTNRVVSEHARARRIPVNVVDQPTLCSFVFPSIVDRSPVLIAVSTGGASPVLARLLRARLESFIPAAFGRLAALARDYRERVKERLPAGPARRLFWERVLEGPIAEQVLAGREQAARAAFDEALQHTDPSGTRPRGEVYLVGAGPGDPDLLTFRALRLMQRADVVLYDRLVSPPILEMTRRDADRIYVGKERDRHALRQEEINDLLAKLALEGKRVLRLKGGDPFIFGRGGEEIETLSRHGIPFQVVPGITAAAGCAAYAGIPLTHRDYAQSCVFVTGQLKDGTVDLNWNLLSQPRQTVVIYMGLSGLGTIAERLIAHGVPPDLPAALVEQGTTAEQRVLTATLATLPERVAAAQPKAPTLVILGEVVRLREKLAWFEGAHE